MLSKNKKSGSLGKKATKRNIVIGVIIVVLLLVLGLKIGGYGVTGNAVNVDYEDEFENLVGEGDCKEVCDEYGYCKYVCGDDIDPIVDNDKYLCLNECSFAYDYGECAITCEGLDDSIGGKGPSFDESFAAFDFVDVVFDWVTSLFTSDAAWATWGMACGSNGDCISDTCTDGLCVGVDYDCYTDDFNMFEENNGTYCEDLGIVGACENGWCNTCTPLGCTVDQICIFDENGDPFCEDSIDDGIGDSLSSGSPCANSNECSPGDNCIYSSVFFQGEFLDGPLTCQNSYCYGSDDCDVLWEVCLSITGICLLPDCYTDEDCLNEEVCFFYECVEDKSCESSEECDPGYNCEFEGFEFAYQNTWGMACENGIDCVSGVCSDSICVGEDDDCLSNDNDYNVLDEGIFCKDGGASGFCDGYGVCIATPKGQCFRDESYCLEDVECVDDFGEGYYCEEGSCIPGNCISDADCFAIDPTYPECQSDNTCGLCTDSYSCVDPSYPICQLGFGCLPCIGDNTFTDECNSKYINEPICDSSGSCRGCSSNEECTDPFNSACDIFNGNCVPCSSHNQCDDNVLSKCSFPDYECVRCTEHSHCTNPEFAKCGYPVGLVTNQECLPCDSDEQCFSAGFTECNAGSCENELEICTNDPSCSGWVLGSTVFCNTVDGPINYCDFLPF